MHFFALYIVIALATIVTAIYVVIFIILMRYIIIQHEIRMPNFDMILNMFFDTDKVKSSIFKLF